jgi:hypothetical protein
MPHAKCAFCGGYECACFDHDADYQPGGPGYAGDAGATLRILYRNHRNVESWRRIRPGRMEFTSTDWHPEPQWILHALDVDRGAERPFAMRDIIQWDYSPSASPRP